MEISVILYLLECCWSTPKLNSIYRAVEGSIILCKLLPLLFRNGAYSNLNLLPPTSGAFCILLRSNNNFELVDVPVSICTPVAICCFTIFIKSGASVSIAKTLYLAFSLTNVLSSVPFFKIKNVSMSSLLKSEDGKANQTLPSLAS